ncbi:MAG: transglycosylase domain-containing protein, partial [Lachnospiraceae bacterium]
MSDQDFSRFAVDRELDEMAVGSAKLEKKVGVIALRLVVVAILSVVVICFAGAFGAMRGVIDNTPDISKVNIEPVGYATFVYDAGGNMMQKLSTADANRIQVSLDEVPDGVKTAFIVLEDSRFYQHSGVDVRGIVRALSVGFQSGLSRTEGASTITQQLLKNNYFQNWTEEKALIDRLRRKVQEQYMAVQLEERLERELGSRKAAKDRILESYLNTINLGAGTFGVQAAARKYFGKNVDSLSISEAAVIAGITQNPSRYNPITHPEENAVRREKALRLMLEQGYITEAMWQEAMADNVYERIAAAQDIGTGAKGVYSYFVDELTQQVLSDLVSERLMDEDQAQRLLYAGGLKIYSTEDMAIQQICDEEYADPDNFPEGTKYSLEWTMRVQTVEGNEVKYDKDMLAQHFRETEDAAFDLIFDTADEAKAAIERYKEHLLREGDNILAEDAYLTPEPQSSIVIIDQDSGAVRAIVGGRGEKT